MMRKWMRTSTPGRECASESAMLGPGYGTLDEQALECASAGGQVYMSGKGSIRKQIWNAWCCSATEAMQRPRPRTQCYFR